MHGAMLTGDDKEYALAGRNLRAEKAHLGARRRSHLAKCSGRAHISKTRTIGASKVRLMTKLCLPDWACSRCSASQSQVALPPACLINFAISVAASGEGRDETISIVVLPFASLKVTVTRKSAGRSSLPPWS